MLLDRFGMWNNGMTGINGMVLVGLKQLESPAFSSNFLVNGLTGVGGKWISWQHEMEEISVIGLTGLGRAGFWFSFPVNGLTGMEACIFQGSMK
ncbi:hypothetical protein Nepgr_015240 [Nepenthes gracilis]|uniref:Uncharacterized protein n=1 Tax=Nepenthes gracilis TaxID=150966 RepID=A0AAD3SMI5_NEPGR|nr:hypothetical protein Nepgr_015240 [Nepenthes gracilis]